MSATESPGVERMKVWRCIGCGRIDGPQPCIGVCEDRKAELVFASDYDDALAQASLVRARADALEALVLRLAHTTPRDGEWQRCYQVMQDQARRVLAAISMTQATADQAPMQVTEVTR